MIITDNFVYIHVPRTAGATAESIFIRDYNLRMSPSQHDTLVDVDEESYVGKYIFGFVRNPFSSEYSYWRHSLKLREWPEVTFEDWIKFRYAENGFEDLLSKYTFQDFHQQFIWIRHSLMRNPQAGFFSDKTGKCAASRIFKFEHLHDSWQEITESIGIDMMGVEYTPASEEYKDHYNDFTYSLVASARKYDLDLFGYTFDDNGDNDCTLDYDLGSPVNPQYCFNRDFINL